MAKRGRQQRKRTTRGDDHLTWVASLKQWRKRYRGATHYLGTGQGKSDRAAHRRALSKWHRIKAEADDAARQQALEKKQKEVSDAYAAWGEQLRATHPESFRSRQAPDISPARAEQHERYRHDLSRMHLGLHFAPSSSDGNASKLITEYLDEYIAEQRQRYEHGRKFPDAPRSERIGAARLIAYEHNVELLRKAWISNSLPTTETSMARLIQKFRKEQKSLLDQGVIKPNTFNERFKTVRHFLTWLHNNFHIESLPRTLPLLCAKYNYTTTAKAVALDDIHRLWGDGDERFKVYIALALNCGYYAVDISNLEHAHIRGSHILNDRHKTGVPVRYKLWDVTRKLLSSTCSGPDHLAFAAKDGGPLLRHDTKKRSRVCEIDNDLRARCKRLKIKGVSFSNFRDTSSTLIEGIDRSVTDIFDGHKDARMAARYIDNGSVDLDRLYAPLDAATDELEAHYGLTLD